MWTSIMSRNMFEMEMINSVLKQIDYIEWFCIN